MERPSKTQKKQAALSLQELGEKLVELTDEQLNRIELPEDIRKAVDLARTITKRGGRKRQLQYIGVLMRKVDAEGIRQAVRDIEEGNRKEAAVHKQVETWRDELISGSDALADALASRLSLDRERLQKLILAARKEHSGKAPSAGPGRALFRYLREAVLNRPSSAR